MDKIGVIVIRIVSIIFGLVFLIYFIAATKMLAGWIVNSSGTQGWNSEGTNTLSFLVYSLVSLIFCVGVYFLKRWAKIGFLVSLWFSWYYSFGIMYGLGNGNVKGAMIVCSIFLILPAGLTYFFTRPKIKQNFRG